MNWAEGFVDTDDLRGVLTTDRRSFFAGRPDPRDSTRVLGVTQPPRIDFNPLNGIQLPQQTENAPAPFLTRKTTTSPNMQIQPERPERSQSKQSQEVSSVKHNATDPAVKAAILTQIRAGVHPIDATRGTGIPFGIVYNWCRVEKIAYTKRQMAPKGKVAAGASNAPAPPVVEPETPEPDIPTEPTPEHQSADDQFGERLMQEAERRKGFSSDLVWFLREPINIGSSIGTANPSASGLIVTNLMPTAPSPTFSDHLDTAVDHFDSMTRGEFRRLPEVVRECIESLTFFVEQRKREAVA